MNLISSFQQTISAASWILKPSCGMRQFCRNLGLININGLWIPAKEGNAILTRVIVFVCRENLTTTSIQLDRVLYFLFSCRAVLTLYIRSETDIFSMSVNVKMMACKRCRLMGVLWVDLTLYNTPPIQTRPLQILVGKPICTHDGSNHAVPCSEEHCWGTTV